MDAVFVTEMPIDLIRIGAPAIAAVIKRGARRGVVPIGRMS